MPTNTDPTEWHRLTTADPIRLRDPLAELLGMVPEGEPLVFTFPEVAKAAGHACPAVSGAYRATQLALADLYPDTDPVRGEVSVVVDGSPGDPGLGPMASVIEHVTGAAGEDGFAGFGGYGGRDDLLEFGSLPGEEPGRRFAFARTDTGETVRVTFNPNEVGVAPPGGDGGAEADHTGFADAIPKLIQGEATIEERERFYEVWHDRVQRILDADAGPESAFTLVRDE